MSVTTTADAQLEEAKEHVHSAVLNLHQIVDADCWGAKDFTLEYQANMEEAYELLRKVKKLLA